MEKTRELSAASSVPPGEVIRLVRKRKGMTLSDLGAKTGLAVSTLSKLEKGRSSLSYDKLMLLSQGLDVDMSELLNSAPAAAGFASASAGGGRRVVHRAGEGRLLETDSYRQLYLASELLNKRFTPLIAEAKARTIQEYLQEFGELIRHPGEEFAFVLEGEVEFHTEHYAPVRLKAGDSIYFDSEMGHAYLKGSEETCRLVAVCAPRGTDAEMIETFENASERHAVSSKPVVPEAPRVVRAKARAGRPQVE